MARLKYKQDIHDLIILLVGQGATEKVIAEQIGISYATLQLWKNKYPKLKEDMIKEKIHIDLEVVQALRRNATGYTVQEVEQVEDELGNIVSRKVKDKYITPSSQAQIFWLRNRNKEWNEDKAKEMAKQYIKDILFKFFKAREEGINYEEEGMEELLLFMDERVKYYVKKLAEGETINTLVIGDNDKELEELAKVRQKAIDDYYKNVGQGEKEK